MRNYTSRSTCELMHSYFNEADLSCVGLSTEITSRPARGTSAPRLRKAEERSIEGSSKRISSLTILSRATKS
jgi:hypothetical protein